MHIDTRNGAPSSKIQNQESSSTSNKSSKGPIQSTKDNINNLLHRDGTNQSTTTSSSQKVDNRNLSGSYEAGNTASSMNGSSSMNNSSSINNPSASSRMNNMNSSSMNNNATDINDRASAYNAASCSNGDCSQTKQNVSSFLRRDGQADTDVHESMNPAIVHEHISNTQLNENQAAIDREHHLPHQHISVQPVRDRASATTTAEHQVAPTQTREVMHGDEARSKQRLAEEQAQFRSTRDVGPTKQANITNPSIVGEHEHHHVHEKIQPVVDKDIHQQHIIHTTQPIREVHHNETIHHQTSVLPEVSMDEFKRSGGTLDGRGERVDAFKGAPRRIDDSSSSSVHNNVLGGKGAKGSTTVTANTDGYDSMNSSSMDNSSMKSSALNDRNINNNMSGASMRNTNVSNINDSSNLNSSNLNSSSMNNSSSTGKGLDTETFDQKAGIKRSGNPKTTTTSSKNSSSKTNTGIGSGSANSSSTAGGAGYGAGAAGAGVVGSGAPSTGLKGVKSADSSTSKTRIGNASNETGSSNNTSSTSTDTGTRKGSMMDKLNPTKDSTGQGNPGFMH